MPLEVHIREEGSTTVVELVSTLDSALPTETRQRILSHIKPGCRVVIDLSRLSQLSGTGLRMLLLLSRYVQALGGVISAAGAPQELRDIAEAAGFLHLFRQAPPVAPHVTLGAPPVTRINIYPTHHHAGFALRPGVPLPFGATVLPRGVNFSVYSRHASACTLALFDPGVVAPVVEIPSPPEFRIGDVFAMMVFDLDPDTFEYGFRFDLASILGRDADGTPLPNPPLLESLAMDPVLGKTKLIAEAWDAGGLYQVGTFPAYGRWAEWNGPYRDCLRRFLKGDMREVGDMAQRLLGSPDLYLTRGPTASINFVTCHDGFTLAALVSYNHKHNEANGEENRDGTGDNQSWNCGAEGRTDDLQIVALRRRQIKNALTMLLLSQGLPMLLMGDELGRTQLGNNNAYCHDSPLT